eukprot:6178075-Pleurochrysis_carterae.AAC.1
MPAISSATTARGSSCAASLRSALSEMTSTRTPSSSSTRAYAAAPPPLPPPPTPSGTDRRIASKLTRCSRTALGVLEARSCGRLERVCRAVLRDSAPLSSAPRSWAARGAPCRSSPSGSRPPRTCKFAMRRTRLRHAIEASTRSPRSCKRLFHAIKAS